MTATPDLIDALAANLKPVRRLRPPVARAARWLLFAAVVLSLLVIGLGLPADLTERLHDPTFLVSTAATVSTGILAAIAAFMLSLPDRSRLWWLLPAPTLVVWLFTVGHQCLTDWGTIQPDGLQLGQTARCFATLVVTSVPLSLTMLVMLRYAAPLRPVTTALTGGLAVAAITATALSLFHALDHTVMVLAWTLGMVAILIGLAGAFGRKMLSRAPPRSAPTGE